MKFRSVAFMPFKAVERILLGKPFHKTVSAHFRDNRSKRNNRLCLISTNDGFLKQKFFWSMEKSVEPHFALRRLDGNAREDRPDAEPYRSVVVLAGDVRRSAKECKRGCVNVIIGVEKGVAGRTRFDKEHGSDGKRARLVQLADNLAVYST